MPGGQVYRLRREFVFPDDVLNPGNNPILDRTRRFRERVNLALGERAVELGLFGEGEHANCQARGGRSTLEPFGSVTLRGSKCRGISAKGSGRQFTCKW